MSAKYTKKELENSRVEVSGVIPFEDLIIHEEIALARLAKELEVDGFRKGQVPAATARQYIQDMAILEAMAEEALMKEYGDIINTHAPNAIGRPEINITKIGRGNPMEFKMTMTVVPEIKLPDYKKIAKEENKNKQQASLSDEEVEKSLLELQKMRAGAGSTHTHEDGTIHNEDHSEITEDNTDENKEDIKLPELNDEFAQSFGDSFKTMDDLKEKIRENMMKEKEMIESDKVRMAIGDKIISEIKISLPDMLIDGEIERMLYRMESDIANSGMTLEDYTKMIGKTLDELKTEWRPSAEKRVKLQMALDEIAKIEKLEADKDRVEKEVEQLKNMYKDLDPLRAKLYVEGQLKNEKTFEFLDAQ